ncbi:MAG TPA: metal-dependent hydrolase [Solirubrobacteraceae bacterium]|nr:metal-dependent hydrolase [Solirubrobacteraceae bacterium]
MRPQAHIAASLVIWGCGNGRLAEAPVCALCGNLPDFDRNVAKALGVQRRDHHRWVSHSLVGWLPPSVLALRAARGTRHAPAVRRGVAAVWLHLLCDTYADGLAWLWPLDKEKIGLFMRNPELKDAGWKTPAPLSSHLGRVEAVLWAAAAVLALRRVAQAR